MHRNRGEGKRAIIIRAWRIKTRNKGTICASGREAFERFVRGATAADAGTVGRPAAFRLMWAGGCADEGSAGVGVQVQVREARAERCAGAVAIGINENRTVDVAGRKAIVGPM